MCRSEEEGRKGGWDNSLDDPPLDALTRLLRRGTGTVRALGADWAVSFRWAHSPVLIASKSTGIGES